MRKLILSLVVVAVIAACNDRDDNLEGVNLRIQNSSSSNFTTVTVGDERLVFENVISGSYSDYQEVVRAYQQDTVHVVADSLDLRFVPEIQTDSLPLGVYTYELSISEEGQLQFQFKID
ncbi:hypothetical protein [Flavobacterium sp. ASW18X]|uniref:hypothetical protein n=1 Tax=Flavobacterium sp. ASW18X TaxID=2572595 RepID=UPI0010AED43A|nr:hypothetical protein [Flavobacterium sp. ASW18X]TKD59059.1 hypothetical protein FBT53_14195 [Flavobacterium sp. ASW18X]